MNEQEEKILDIIKEYFKVNKAMPTIRFIQKKMNYKSTNSVFHHLKGLEKRNYLVRNENNNLIINNPELDNNTILITIINTKEKIQLQLDKRKKYLGFLLKNNFFLKDYICKGDILIIQITNNLKTGDLGLFIIDNKYQIMKYKYINGFYILKGKEEIILHKVTIIGKVIMAIKKMRY